MTLILLKSLASLLAGVFNMIVAYEAHKREDSGWRRLAPLAIALGLFAVAGSNLAALI
jgi:uncharacterized membrane protein HdeD (DUF308 family)